MPPDGIPLDPDVEVDDPRPARTPRPVHLRPAYVGIVVLGGTIGTGVRELLSLAIPATGAFPIAILLINLTGAFALGVLLELLLKLGPDEGYRRRLRLLIGTGVMGGYTTYSTLAIGTVEALQSGHPFVGSLYAVGSIIAGAAAGFAGIAAAAEAHRWATASRKDAEQ